MEKNNGKVVAIVALVVAVVALSVGFAAFADDLTISGATANVTASGNAFDAAAGSDLRYKTNSAKCYLTSDNNKTAISGANVGTLSEDAWTGISVPLGSAAADVTCEAVVENKTAYKAYLTSLGTTTGLTCTSSGNNATANQTAVCANTTVNVSVSTDSQDTIAITTSSDTLSPGHGYINANGEATVTVNIVYTGATIDQDTTITIPTITHSYSSISNSGS